MRDGTADGRRRAMAIAGVALAMAAVADVARAAAGPWQFMRRGFAGGGNNLPVSGTDGHGNGWMVYQPWALQSQSNMPVYGQTANLQVNGQQPTMTGPNAARVDDKTGELVLSNMSAGPVAITRRVLIDVDAGGVRVVDVFKNTAAAEQQVSVQLSSTINYGVQNSQLVPDPKNASRNLAWIAQVPVGAAKVAVDVYAGPGGKVCPTLDNTQQGNNVCQATAQLTVPANGQVAVVHYHLIVPTAEAGQQWVTAMRPAKLLADLPPDVRRSVVNFRVSAGLLGDLEVLRGDLLDVVELRNGDRLNGNLTDTRYKLDTFYGTVELPMDHVVGIVNTGAYRPRQLMVTADGQIFGGHLEQPAIGMELTSGQKVSIPLAQVARVGYRKRAGEAGDDATAADADAAGKQLKPPYLLLATGDRVGVSLPAEPVSVMTRYGPLSLPPGVLANIAFTGTGGPDDSGVHTVTLTDGSHFAGLVTTANITATLTTAADNDKPAAPISFPIGSLSRIVFAAADDPADTHATPDDAPALHVRKDDLLVGTLTGSLKVDTAFDTVTVDAAGVRSLAPSKENPAELAVVTWDGTTFNGQVEDPTVACHLSSGVDVRVPVALIDGYTNPAPTVPALLQGRIEQLVKDLDADDWQARDAAEKQLVKLGPAVAGTLKTVRDKQPPEAQQRIDVVLRQLTAAGVKK